MDSFRKQRWQQLQSVFEPGFKQMLLVSIMLHLLLPVLYYSPFFPQHEIEKPLVYRVNLVNKPVKNPQAGRPEATPVKKKPVVKPKPKTETETETEICQTKAGTKSGKKSIETKTRRHKSPGNSVAAKFGANPSSAATQSC